MDTLVSSHVRIEVERAAAASCPGMLDGHIAEVGQQAAEQGAQALAFLLGSIGLLASEGSEQQAVSIRRGANEKRIVVGIDAHASVRDDSLHQLRRQRFRGDHVRVEGNDATA
ncbi:hypothetical protein D3C76_705180 [compost metagenome]